MHVSLYEIEKKIVKVVLQTEMARNGPQCIQMAEMDRDSNRDFFASSSLEMSSS